jgi:hypothetical protein
MNSQTRKVTEFSGDDGQDAQNYQLGRNSDHHLGSRTAVDNGGDARFYFPGRAVTRWNSALSDGDGAKFAESG